jgi:hypothetical protein
VSACTVLVIGCDATPLMTACPDTVEPGDDCNNSQLECLWTSTECTTCTCDGAHFVCGMPPGNMSACLAPDPEMPCKGQHVIERGNCNVGLDVFCPLAANPCVACQCNTGTWACYGSPDCNAGADAGSDASEEGGDAAGSDASDESGDATSD